jgi:hypothetical protein
MAKGIIFVGGGNLNRNQDQQSMYNYGYRNQYSQQKKDSRTRFYKELCLQSRTVPGEKGRNKKIKQLRLKYIDTAVSEKTIEKVFIAYSECFNNKMNSKEKKKRIIDLPGMLEKNKVDKRVIKRILEIEGLDNENKNNLKLKKDSISHILNPEMKSNSKKKERLKKFHEMLNDYLINSYLNDQVVMDHELKRMCHLFSRDFNYVNNLKIIYREMIENNSTFLESSEKHTFISIKLIQKDFQKIGMRTKKINMMISFNDFYILEESIPF